MDTKHSPSSSCIEALQSANEHLELQLIELKAKLAWYEEQYRLFKHKQFGAASERYEGQGLLFNEAEAEAIEDEEPTEEDESQTQIVSTHTRKKKTARQSLKDNTTLARSVDTIDLAECDKLCGCGLQRFPMGEEISYKLKVVPAQAEIIEIHRPKYGCSCEDGIKIAPMPKMPIPKSIATAELLAWIITSKYCDGLPLYRLGFIAKRMGVEIARATMADWMIRSALLLERVYLALVARMVEQTALQADETPIQVLDEPERNPQSKSCMWIYRTTGMQGAPVILYDYQTGRGHEHPDAFLQGFKGYLQCDGMSAYKALSEKRHGIRLVGCMAHLRRKFKEALDAMPKKDQQAKKISRSEQALNMIRNLYAIEQRIKDKSEGERYRIRQEESKPVLDKLKQWLDKQQALPPPKSLLGKAITYGQNQWPYLVRYLESGLLDIDNNAAERAIKPFVIGRKNWLFAHSVKGARASAILYSLVETAKANGLEPFAWLTYVLKQLPELGPDDSVDYLLPMNLTLQDIEK